MATYGWRSDRSVTEHLFAEGFRFDFYQAVRLLEQIRPEATRMGEGAEPEREPVRFASRVRFDFPATDIGGVRGFPQGEGQPEMAVHFMGLAGGFGPLPAAYTELILDRLRHRDTAFRDFLDIFNHRLVSLLYRVRKAYRVGFDFQPPDQVHFARHCFALLGIGTDGLRGRMGIDDRALLFYTGLLAQRPRSMAGLETFLSSYFEAPVKGMPFVGGWRALAESQVTKLGRLGQNQRLGQEVVLGSRVWDQTACFALQIGSLKLNQFRNFLPNGSGFRPLCELVRFYAGQAFQFEIELILEGSEVPESRLGATEGPRLGWTSWLKAEEFEAEDSSVRLSGAS